MRIGGAGVPAASVGSPEWREPVASPGLLPAGGNTVNDRRVVADDGDGKPAGYVWTGVMWLKMTDPDAITAMSATVSNITVADTPFMASLNSFVFVDASGGIVVVETPAAATSAGGGTITVKKTDASANVVTIDPNAAETIDGLVTQDLTVQNQSIEIASDTSNWLIVA